MNTTGNIAFVCHPYHRGGVTRWMADAAMAAARQGKTVYFVTVVPSRPFVSAGGREPIVQLFAATSGLVHIVAQPAGFTFEFGTEDFRAGIYRSLILAHVPQGTPIIVSDDMAAWAAAASVAGKYPMIGVLHGDQDYYYDRAAKYQRQLSLCVCVSGRIGRTMAQKCPALPAAKISVIPCGIELPEFSRSVPDDTTLRLAFIGRLTDYEKRAEDLVKIAGLLHSKGVSFHLDIAGNDDASKVSFTDNFTTVGTADFVTFHGWQDKTGLQRILNSTDILLLTSNSEGMPLVMMEALASGCGFTGTRVSGIEDYEHDARAADCVSVYAVGNIEDAVAKITAIAAVPAGVRAAAARQLAVAAFSVEVCLDRYFTAIGKVGGEAITPAVIDDATGGKIYSKAIALARYLKVRMR